MPWTVPLSNWTVHKVINIREDRYQSFAQEGFIYRSKAITVTLQKNNVASFSKSNKALQEDCALFSRLQMQTANGLFSVATSGVVAQSPEPEAHDQYAWRLRFWREVALGGRKTGEPGEKPS